MDRNRAVLYVAVLIMCGSVAWFVSNPTNLGFNWPPVLAFFGALVTLIKAESESAKSSEPVENQNDRLLLETLRRELSRHTIDLLERTDFLIDFDGNLVRQLEQFWRGWDNEDHRFFDAVLEKSRRQLLVAISSCLDLIARYATIEDNDVWRIRTMDQRHQVEFEKMWGHQAREIRGYADKIVRHYNDIVRRGRGRFPDTQPGGQ